MHKYANEITTDNTSNAYNRNRYTFRDYFGEDSATRV